MVASGFWCLTFKLAYGNNIESPIDELKNPPLLRGLKLHQHHVILPCFVGLAIITFTVVRPAVAEATAATTAP